MPTNKKSKPLANLLNNPSIQTTGDNKSATYLPISEQIRKSFHKTNRMPMLTGCILGAFVPIAVYLTAHSEAMQEHGALIPTIQAQPFLSVLIAGGLIFSATSVSRWGYQAFGNSWVKAIAFVVLVEGTLVFSPIQWLGLAALGYLVIINALATGTTLALDRKKHFALQNKGGRPPKAAQQAAGSQPATQQTENTPTVDSPTGKTTARRKKSTAKSNPASTELAHTESPVPEPTFPELEQEPAKPSQPLLSELLGEESTNR